MKRDNDNLIRELRLLYADHDTTNFGVLDFVSAFGSPLDAAAYARLFWPEFVELDGMLFRAEVAEDESDIEQIRQVLKESGGDRIYTEQAFNIVDVPSSIFGGRRVGESSEQIDLELAELLGEMWRAKLNLNFPGRSFVVDVDLLQNGEEPTITFHELREPGRHAKA